MRTATPTLGLVIQWGSDGWTGGPNYLKNLALAAAALPSHLRPHLVYLVRPDQVETFGQYQGILPLAKDVRLFAENVPLNDIDLLYPCPVEAGFSPAAPRAYWIADFQHRRLPRMFSQEDIDWRDRTYASLARGRNMVVLSSQTALDDFRAFYEVTCPTHVLRFATSPEPGWTEGDPGTVQARHGVAGPYLMCCNQFWAHKDHLTLFRALVLLRERGLTPQLVCTGATEDHRHPDHFPSLLRFLEDHELGNQVRVLGLIERGDQIQLLRGAQGGVQPSLFEGWSTVIEDCRLLGKTVIYSDIPVHLEQAVPHGIPFQAGDPAHLAQVLERAIPALEATAGTEIERRALAAGADNRLRFGLEIVRLMEQAREAPSGSAPEPDPVVVERPPVRPATTDETRGNSFRIKGTQWYDPPLAGASTFAASLFDLEIYHGVLGVLKKLPDDDYCVFLRGFMSRALKRFGPRWRYADLCTVLYTLAESLDVENYLEIGVRQGRSLAMVVSRRPTVEVMAFDMWLKDYASMANPGPDFVREQMVKLGHEGRLTFVEGNSHETLPAYFAKNPRQSFDLITVDGDHSPAGAAADLRAVLPHLRIGGALVFDDIAHPSHPELQAVWREIVLAQPGMSGFAFTELGYGVAFAVRMR